MLVPTNVLIFALENLIFLLYPYRLSDDGLGVFFRSILTFTAKGLLFAAALGATWLWALAAHHISRQLPFRNLPCAAELVFLAGMWLLIAVAAAASIAALVRVFRKFDPSTA